MLPQHLQKYGEPQKCLDHGFVRLVDVMGDDAAIVQAARVSYGDGTRSVSEDRGLIRYLYRRKHTTPFEMCEIKLHCKMPLFIARQWIRHRTANVNEMSGRYSILPNEFYIPEPEVVAQQSKVNKQGRDEVLTPEESAFVLKLLKREAERQYETYQKLLNDDGEGNPVVQAQPMLARELARMGLGLNFYTEWYWKIDLHNLLHFLSLRMDSHAQHEIRVFADAIGNIVESWCPYAWEAFNDYHPYRGARTFSRMEVEALRKLTQMAKAGLAGDEKSLTLRRLFYPTLDEQGMSDREKKEFWQTLGIRP